MHRQLVLEFVRVTEAAAIESAKLVGRGDKMAADAKAVSAMRRAFDSVSVRGTVVIGEGEMDEAPMLYIGEEVGRGEPGHPEIDIAVDPLEGTNLCALGRPGAIATLAAAKRGNLLHAPDIYMEKIASGAAGRGVISLQKTPTENVHALAEAKGCRPQHITVVVLDRPRHRDLIAELRRVGARILTISDGDVAPAVAACLPDTGIDMLYGSGGAPEGVLAAAAIASMEGEFQGRLLFEDEEQRRRAKEMGRENPDGYLGLDDLVRGDAVFVASGVTDGPLLQGIRREGDRLWVHSVAMRRSSGTVRWVEASVRAERFDGPEF